MDEEKKPGSEETDQPASRSALPEAEQQIPTTPEPDIALTEVSKELEAEPQEIAQPTSQVYVPKSTGAVEVKPSKLQKLKDFWTECVRVIRVTKKPDKGEFKTIVKISGIGMAIIGFIGFLVHFIKELIF